MLAALAFWQASAVRASMADELVLQRFCVLSPSVSRMITLSLSGEGSEPCGSGRSLVSACQGHTRPLVTLVFPASFMASLLLFRVVQPVGSTMSVNGSSEVSCPHCDAG